MERLTPFLIINKLAGFDPSVYFWYVYVYVRVRNDSVTVNLKCTFEVKEYCTCKLSDLVVL